MADHTKVPKLAESLFATLRQNLADTVVDVTEVAVDATLNDGLFRDLPIIGTIVAVSKTGLALRDALFTRKVLNFLSAAATVSPDERRRFVDGIEARGGVRELGEALLLLLDRQEAMEKSEILGKLFAAYVRGVCDREQFDLLAYALDRMPIPLMPPLRAFYGVGPGPHMIVGGEELSELVGTGLVRLQFSGAIGGSGGGFSHTRVGTLFLKIIDGEV